MTITGIKKKVSYIFLFGLFLYASFINAQDSTFRYELDLTIKNDAFNVTLFNPELGSDDQIYSFVSFAPGVHQPLDFGRFVKLFKAYDNSGKELLVQKIATNDFKIMEPERVHKIIYEIDDSFDMSIDYHPVYPMSGTGITDDYVIINTHGVFGYFEELKDNPIELKLKLEGNPKVGTSLNLNEKGVYEIESYYQLTDSPILIGDSLSYHSVMLDEIKVEAYVHSKNGIVASMVLEAAQPVLNAAKEYIGYSPVERYTLLLYFANHSDISRMKVFQFGGALEHSLSSTYALPDRPEYIRYLKDIIAHEFMHILSPLHLHSEVLANFDYSDPVSEDMHVWLYEGVTEWVSYKMQLTGGVVTFDDYLNFLSQKVIKSEEYSDDYSLVRISKEWSTEEGLKQYGNIYQLGALTAAMLDIKLLDLSGGEKGLREVYLELIRKYGKDKPFDNQRLFEDLVEMTYPEIGQFISDHINGNTGFDFNEIMKEVGVRYVEQRENTEGVATMGLDIVANKDGHIIINDLTAEYKGDLLQKGDRILKVLDLEFNNGNYHSIMNQIKAMQPGDPYTIEIIREQKELSITESLYTKIDKHVFEVDPEASERALRLRDRLLKN